VKEGDHVQAGQVLGQIDRQLGESQEAQYRGAVASAVAQTAQIRANLAQDKRDLARAQALVDAKLMSKADLEKTETALQLDEARLATQIQLVAQNKGQLQTALYSLSRATLTAPIEGTILELYHKVGERIRGSDYSEDVVLLMGGLSNMEVKAEVGEHEVVNVHVGNEAIVEIDAIPDREFKGRVVAVGKNAQIKNPGSDAEVTTFIVRVELDSPPDGGLPGMSATVSIDTATRTNVLTVPIQAVTSRAPKSAQSRGNGTAAPAKTSTTEGKPKQDKVVFVVANNEKAQMRIVHTGIASRTDVEILDGLKEGEIIVDGPYRTLARDLADGQTVKKQEMDEPSEKEKGPQGDRK
jgi:HlyD family secretion protein